MEKTDITFKICDVRVNCRAVAVIIDNDSILFQKRNTDSAWALPGGKIAILEKGIDTINREMKEEIGEEIEISELYDVEENFFEYNEEKYHEYMFIYLAKLKDDSRINDNKFFDGIETNKHLQFAWFNREDLEKYNIVPFEIIEVLKNIVDNNSNNIVKSRLRRYQNER